MGKKINIGVLGLGTVGGGVVKILHSDRERILRESGLDLHLAKACDLNPERAKELGIPDDVFTSDAATLLDGIDVLVELVGGDRFGDMIQEALAKGISVVTANKALLAKRQDLMGGKGGELLFYEASCVGGVPIISAFEEGLRSSSVFRLHGIFNGTCNYIVTEMSNKDLAFETALYAAQEKGYAEADPTFDIEGVDATHKLSLLSSLAFKKRVPFELLKPEGIKALDKADFAWARENNFSIKLVSVAEKDENGNIFAGTFPAMVPENHPLAHVEGSFNAVLLEGDNVGPLMFYGHGAGEMPTASAVVSDIISAGEGRIRNTSKHVFSSSEVVEEICDERAFSFYIRLAVIDKPGALSKISGVLATQGISLRFVHQEMPDEDGTASLILMTHPHNYASLVKAFEELTLGEWVTIEPLILRVLEAPGSSQD